MVFVERAKEALKNEKGAAVVVWVSIMLLFMSTFTALLVETGDLLVRKHIVQAVADAAALSGSSAVNVVMGFDPESHMPTSEIVVLQTDAYGGGMSQIYADQLLAHNMAQMDFAGKGIVLAGVDINGTMRDPVEYSAGDPISVTGLDGSVVTYYRDYGMVLNGYMTAPLWGSVFGHQKVKFSIPARAKPLYGG
ncbi:MAG: hypothetical protein HPY89_11195 [Pelotomaculum sp.]|nr:hypothetical protein [Pelotomaculum sp.]